MNSQNILDRYFQWLILVLILSTLFLSHTPNAFCEEIPTLTLQRSTEIALTDNSLIREMEEKQRAAVEAAKGARADLFPKLSAGYSFAGHRDQPYAVFSGVGRVAVAHKNNYRWDLTLSQPLFTGFALSTRVKMSRLGIDISDFEKEQAVLDVVKEVKRSYFQILLAQKGLHVTADAVRQLDSHVNDAERFYAEGVIPYNDLLRSRVALAEARQEQVSAEKTLEMSRSVFNTLLNIDLNRTIFVEDVLSVPSADLALDSLLERAVNMRPELKVLSLVLKNADYAVRVARSSYYPEVALVASVERNGDDLSARNNDFANSHNSKVALEARWGFFEWGKTRSEVKKLLHEKASIEVKIEGIRESIQLEVKDAFLNLRVAETNIKTAEKALAHARENFRITDLQYRHQMATSSDVLDARTFQTEAEMNYYGSLYGYMISLAELKRAVGEK